MVPCFFPMLVGLNGGDSPSIVRQNIGVFSHFESQDLDSEWIIMVYRMLCYGVVWIQLLGCPRKLVKG